MVLKTENRRGAKYKVGNEAAESFLRSLSPCLVLFLDGRSFRGSSTTSSVDFRLVPSSGDRSNAF